MKTNRTAAVPGKMQIMVAAMAMAVLAASCKTRVNYECQCYKEGVHTNNYEIGKMDGNLVKDRCLAIQQQNQEDTCIGSGVSK